MRKMLNYLRFGSGSESKSVAGGVQAAAGGVQAGPLQGSGAEPEFAPLTRGRPAPTWIPRVEDRGVSLQQLRELVSFVRERCNAWTDRRSGAPILPERANLYQVNDWVIRPATQAARCSYVERVAEDAGAQQPSWFVSHWWGEAVADFVQCVRMHVRERGLPPTTAYWVCAYANNQHELGTELGVDPRQSSFFKAMGAAEGVLLVLDEQGPGTPFTRIWCCFEESVAVLQLDVQRERPMLLDIATAKANGSAALLTDGLTAAEQRLEDAAREGAAEARAGWRAKAEREAVFPVEVVQSALTLDITKANSSMEIDKTRILNAVAGRPGHELDDEPDMSSEQYEHVNRRLRGIFAAAAWRQAVQRRPCLDLLDGPLPLARALREDVQRKQLSLSFSGLATFEGRDLEVLAESVPSSALAHLTLDLGGCARLTSTDPLEGCLRRLGKLRELALSFSGCKALTCVEGLGRGLKELLGLTMLDLAFDECLRLSNYDALYQGFAFRQLGTLRLSFRGSLQPSTGMLEGALLASPSQLAELALDFSYCPNLRQLAGLGRGLAALTKLRRLELLLSGCGSLRSIEEIGSGLASLQSLEDLKLDLSNCHQLEALGELGSGLSKQLKRIVVDFSFCYLLADISCLGRGVGTLQQLEELDLNLNDLHLLEDVDALGRALGGLGSLAGLSLSFRGCERLTTTAELRDSLLNLPCIKKLTLRFDNCSMLTSSGELQKSLAALSSRGVEVNLGFEGCSRLTTQEYQNRQQQVEQLLRSLAGEWRSLRLEVGNRGEVEILTEACLSRLGAVMDSHRIQLHSVRSSSYMGQFAESVAEWEAFLRASQSVVDTWTELQSTLLYLQSICSNAKFADQVPGIAGFVEAHAAWKRILSRCLDDPEAESMLRSKGIYEELRGINEKLQAVMKLIQDYLETRRLSLPRLFFMSNDAVLSMFACNSPEDLIPYTRMMFDDSLTLSFQDGRNVTQVHGSLGEELSLFEQVNAEGPTEIWLSKLEVALSRAVRASCLRAREGYLEHLAGDLELEDWLNAWPKQALICAFLLVWSADAEREGGGTAAPAHQRSTVLIKGLAEAVRSGRFREHLVRSKAWVLLTAAVHAKDVAGELPLGGQSKSSFAWETQVRLCLEPQLPQEEMVVRVLGTALQSSYEYTGGCGQLVITPMTDRCYRTCAVALSLVSGCSPVGPAGSGKTETVKEFSNFCGRQCVIVNCSDGMDHLQMGKFLKGVAASGVFVSFDEFNRLSLQVLAAAALQFHQVFEAARAGLVAFDFEGMMLSLKAPCGLFLTMNPGYAGRQELPDDLKAMFRTCAMTVPDYGLIVEVSLFSMGLSGARRLMQQLIALYRTCAEQLSRQHHYDFGMRAVKACLRGVDGLRKSGWSGSEEGLVLEAFHTSGLKVVLEDEPIVRSLVEDIFMGSDLSQGNSHRELRSQLEETLRGSGLQPHPYLLDRAASLYDNLCVRHSVVAVGGPLAGKSAGLRALRLTLQNSPDGHLLRPGMTVEEVRMNPKSVPIQTLYGYFSEATLEWHDGILSQHFRELAKRGEGGKVFSLLVLDGPVDAAWVENLNTVMDDNKKLCLTSGEVIPMPPSMRTFIETGSLAVASPATVSRNGITCFEPAGMGYEHLLESGLADELLPAGARPLAGEIRGMTRWLMPPMVEFAVGREKRLSAQNLAQSYLLLLRPHLDELSKQPSQRGAEEGAAAVAAIDAAVLFVAMWVVGFPVSDKGFDLFVRDLLSGRAASAGFKELHPSLPPDGSVFDWVFCSARCEWRLWKETADPQAIMPGAALTSVVVQTKETLQYGYFIQKCVHHKIKLLLYGSSGTGKTAIARHTLASLKGDGCLPLATGFHARTTAPQTQEWIEGYLEKRGKGISGPALGKSYVLLVDDLNMPEKETYGSQPPLELLRQMVDGAASGQAGGWFDRGRLFQRVVDVLLCGVMAPPGGGRSEVDARLLGHLFLLRFAESSDEHVGGIFSAVLRQGFEQGGLPAEVRDLVSSLTSASLEVYHRTAGELLPTPEKSHYAVQVQHLVQLVHGLLLLDPAQSAGAAQHVRLWAHEAWRTFGDRLTSLPDQQRLADILQTAASKAFGHQLSKEALQAGPEQRAARHAALFNDLRAAAGAPRGEPRPYGECTAADLAALLEEVAAQLEEYSLTAQRRLQLVCLGNLVERLARVSRALRLYGCHGMLLGLKGSSRKGCVRLAAFLSDVEVLQPAVCAGYDAEAFRADLKAAVMLAGCQSRKAVFLVEDAHLAQDGFLSAINTLLALGEVPGLLGTSDLAQLGCLDGEEEASIDAQLAARDRVAASCKRFLSVMLCLSPLSSVLRSRLRVHPALVSHCYIDWIGSWPTDVLTAVANSFLRDANLEACTLSSCAELCASFHNGAIEAYELCWQRLKLKSYVTPKLLTNMISSFKALLHAKNTEIREKSEKYKAGLQRISSLEESVTSLREETLAVQRRIREKEQQAESEAGETAGTILPGMVPAQSDSSTAVASCPRQQQPSDADVTPGSGDRSAKGKLSFRMAGLLRQKSAKIISHTRSQLATLRMQAASCEKKLENAGTLFEALHSERSRWAEKLQCLTAASSTVIRDMFIASGVITYLGVLPPDMRKDRLSGWVDIAKERGLGDAAFSLRSCLGEPALIQSWILNGLADDAFSIENAIIAESAQRWPLCIDPQQQGNKWIKRSQRSRQLLVLNQADQEYAKRLEGAISFGAPVLIENLAEQIDPLVRQVLSQKVYRRGNRLMIQFGDSRVEYNKDFRLFLTTRLRSPHYEPGVYASATLLNFSLTAEGLREQLLGAVLCAELPAESAALARLAAEELEGGVEASEAERRLLYALGHCQGNFLLLEGEEVLELLGGSRQAAATAAGRQQAREHFGQRVEGARQGYAALASEAAELFFLVQDLGSLSPMYRWGLAPWLRLLTAVLGGGQLGCREEAAEVKVGAEAEAAAKAEAAVRARHFLTTFRQKVYEHVCQGLLVQHQHLWSVLLLLRHLRQDGTASAREWQFLCSDAPTPGEVPPRPVEWLPEQAWAGLVRLSRVSEKFAGLVDGFAKEPGPWRCLYDADRPFEVLREVGRRPGAMSKFSAFDDVLVLRCLRPDSVMPALLELTGATLGQEFAVAPEPDLAKVYASSDCFSPLLFVLSSGFRPQDAVAELVRGKGAELESLTMGQGQGPKAEKLIESAMKSGRWVLLQNLEQCMSWLPRLAYLIDEADPGETNANYRLWLTSLPVHDFPVLILQSAVKMAQAGPRGLRANLLPAYTSAAASLGLSGTEESEVCRLAFRTCFLHVSLRLRVSYGPLGFNLPYEFGEGTLHAALLEVRACAEQFPGDPVSAVDCFLSTVLHGSQVTDDMDRRLVCVLIKGLLAPGGGLDGKLPSEGGHDAQLSYISSLPLETPPPALGLHGNAGLAAEARESRQLLQELRQVMGEESSQLGAAGAAAGSDPALEAVDSAAQSLAGTLPTPGPDARPEAAAEDPLRTVLAAEAARFGGLVAAIQQSLDNLKKAVKGLIVMSADLESALLSVQNGRVPSAWLSRSYPSLKPILSYIADLVERLSFFRRWAEQGAPVSFWLGAFFFTQHFLAGVMQRFARKHRVPLPDLAWDFACPREQVPEAGPEDGAYVGGLFLECCQWDWEAWRLEEPEPRVFASPAPLLHLEPCCNSEATIFVASAEAALSKASEGEGCKCECPCYRTSERKGVIGVSGLHTNFVMFIRMTSSKTQAHWTARSAAILLQLDE